MCNPEADWDTVGDTDRSGITSVSPNWRWHGTRTRRTHGHGGTKAQPADKPFNLYDTGGLYLTVAPTGKPDVTERQLAHAERNKVRAVYNRAQYMAERIKMMQAWADYLDALKQGGNVVPIRKRAV